MVPSQQNQQLKLVGGRNVGSPSNPTEGLKISDFPVSDTKQGI
jgi:hypothetical protein